MSNFVQCRGLDHVDWVHSPEGKHWNQPHICCKDPRHPQGVIEDDHHCCSWVQDLIVKDLDKANLAMKDTANMVGKLHNRKLCPVFENRVLFATGRLENGIHHILSRTKLAILSPKTRLLELVMTPYHSVDQSTPEVALFRSRKNAWMFKGKHLATLL